MDIRAAMNDPQLFAAFVGGKSWHAWHAILSAMQGLPLSDAEAETFSHLTGRTQPPQAAAEELWVAAGRRGGKTRAAAVLATYLAALRDYRDVLAPGERAIVLLLGRDTRQARVAFGYAEALVDHIPMIRQMVTHRTSERISLSNQVDLEVRPASFRGLRGPTFAAVVCDEIAYWLDSDAGSANPADAILDAVRPGLATTGGPLIAISSPYRRTGPLWETFQESWGKDHDPVLVVRAPSRDLNPTLPQKVVDRALARDEAAARAEYLAEFRTDIESFVPVEAVDTCMVSGRQDVRPVAKPAGMRYRAFVDPSGGAQDGMTLCIAHSENRRTVVDALRERQPPFDPNDVVREFADLLHRYGLTTVKGDRYGGEWPAERFRAHGIGYRPADRTKGELYRDMLPALMAGEIELPDHPKLRSQLVNLERRTGRGGRDSIDHPPGGHDDLANAVAGVIEGGNRKRAGAL